MGGPGMMFPFMLKKLDKITDAQQAQIDTIMATHRKNFQALFPQMQAAQDALTTKLLTPTPPDSPLKVSDLDTTAISQARAALMNEGLQFAVDIHNVLTSEQLGQAANLRAQVKALRDQERALMGGSQQQ